MIDKPDIFPSLKNSIGFHLPSQITSSKQPASKRPSGRREGARQDDEGIDVPPELRKVMRFNSELESANKRRREAGRVIPT